MAQHRKLQIGCQPLMPRKVKTGALNTGAIGISRRALLGVSLAAPVLLALPRSVSADALWRTLRDGTHLALMRHALAPGVGDPPGFELDACATQRNLSAEGREQAVAIGSLFRANGIASAEVQSSQWCRCLETASLLGLGDVGAQPFLNSFFGSRGDADRQTADLRAWVSSHAAGQATVLVTHQVNITAATGVNPASGEIVVTDRALKVVGRIATGGSI